MKRILTIQDISCVGKVSLGVGLPVISAMGVETCILPTAVLSAHTGFDGFTFHDLTGEITPITEHWKKENIHFDAIYTGYLGSVEQINLVSKLFDDFKSDNTIIVVDPVMGDHGELYPGFNMDFPSKMRHLCSKADIILPNMTEASYLLEIEYKESGCDEEYIKTVLKQLGNLGAKNTALTGVSFDDGRLGVMSFCTETGEFFSHFNTEIHAKYHGTGDIFASCCTGALMNNLPLGEALALAADYTAKCIKTTVNDKNGNWYGVNFEEEIPYLINALAAYKKERDI